MQAAAAGMAMQALPWAPTCGPPQPQPPRLWQGVQAPEEEPTSLFQTRHGPGPRAVVGMGLQEPLAQVVQVVQVAAAVQVEALLVLVLVLGQASALGSAVRAL